MSPDEIHAFIQMNKGIHKERTICKVLGVVRSTLKRKQKQVLPESKKFKAKVINMMVQIWEESNRRYGAPNIKKN